MTTSINRVVLIGNLTRDPELAAALSGQKREAVSTVADAVQSLGARETAGVPAGRPPVRTAPAATTAAVADEDLPF